MKKGKIIAIAIVAAALIVAGAVYLGMDNSTVEDKNIWLCTDGIADISTLSIYSAEDDRNLKFDKNEEDNTWVSEDGGIYEMDEFAPYLSMLGYMKIQNEIENDDLSDYGLDAPEYTIGVGYNNGTEYKYDIGDFVGNGVYVCMDGKDQVYLLNEKRSESVKSMIRSLYNVSLDVINYGEVRAIVTDQDLVFSEDQQDYCLVNRSESPRSDEDFYWNLHKPFSWVADTNVVKEIVQTIEDAGSLKRLPEDKDPSECGLDSKPRKSITLYDTYDNELTIYFGDNAGDGYVYCQTNFLDGVYKVKEEVAETADKTPQDFLDYTMYYYEIHSVTECLIDVLGTKADLTSEWENTSKTQSGNAITTGQRFYLDGKNITGAQNSNLVSWFTETQATDISEDRSKQGDAIGTIEIARISRPYETTISFYEVKGDKDHIMYDLGGTASGLILRTELETFLANVEKLQ